MQTDDAADVAIRPKRVRRSTGPYKAADARRQAILDTAIEHFATWGYFNTSIPKIAADVGMTKTGLLHHFGSKEGLLAAVLEVREQRGTELFFDADGADPLAYFAQIEAQSAFNETQPGLTQMFSILAAEASNSEHPAHDYFQLRYRWIINVSTGILRRSQDAGRLRSDVVPEHVAEEILAVLDGLVVQWGLAQPQFSLQDRVRRYLDRLARAITSDGRGLRD